MAEHAARERQVPGEVLGDQCEDDRGGDVEGVAHNDDVGGVEGEVDAAPLARDDNQDPVPPRPAR